MESLPNLTLDHSVVQVHTNGHYYMDDFMVFPQWYFKGTYYLPFIQRRPSAEGLPNHEYALAWYNIQLHDFKKQQDNIDMGFLRDDLIEGFIAMRKVLHAKMTEFIAQATVEEIQYNEMNHSMRGMHFTSLILKHTLQDYLMTLLTMTLFQCHFLETLTCYTYLSVYLPRQLDVNGYKVDPMLMGMITSNLLVAQEMKNLRVLVWLVQRSDMISPMMNVCTEVALQGPSPEEGLAEVYPGTIMVFECHPSTIHNCACQALQIANIHLSHSVYTAQPGNNFYGSGLMPGKTAELLYFH